MAARLTMEDWRGRGVPSSGKAGQEHALTYDVELESPDAPACCGRDGRTPEEALQLLACASVRGASALPPEQQVQKALLRRE